MKKAIYIPLLVLLFASCAMQDQSFQEDLKIVEKYQQALKDHDFETMKSILADDYVGYGPSVSDTTNKDDALLIWERNMEYLFEKLEFNIAENIAITSNKGSDAGQWVSSWGKLVVKFQKTGKESQIWSNQIFLVKDGKIQKSYLFYNEADALRQAGYHYVYKEPVPLDE